MKIFELVKEILQVLTGNLLYLVSLFVPKQENLWVFGGLLGTGYNDNSKYFFEYINETHKKINAVWISQNPDVLSQLKQNGYQAFSGYSFKGCWTAMRAEVAVISHSRVRDIKPFVITRRTKLVQLWHGIPLKKIEFDDTVFFNKPTLYHRIGFMVIYLISPAFRRKADMFIACSKEDQRSFASAFRVNAERVRITGYPRNDALFVPQTAQPDNGTDDITNILYVPTFRGVEQSDFVLFESSGFDATRLDRYLDENKMKLYIKLHPYNRPADSLLEKIQTCDNIIFYEESDIYNYLAMFDILVTDFSSIYFDFLLLDRPIVFAPFDMNQYMQQDRQFYYEYDAVTPGPVARNWQEVEDCLLQCLIQPNLYSAKREVIKKQFHRFHDNRSCDRVFEQIASLL